MTVSHTAAGVAAISIEAQTVLIATPNRSLRDC